MVWRMCWISARGDFERCRDLVQEVSIALWLHFDKLRPDTSPHEEKAWVRWLTRTTLDHQCRHQRPPMLALTNAMAESIPENGSMAEDIEDLMAVLSSEEQQLLRLHIEGYRADEIAQTMGLNRDAVYVDTVLHKWLLSVDQDERASLIKTLFDVLESTNASRFGDEFWSNLLKNPAAFLSAIFSTDREQVSQAAKVLKSLVSAIMSTPFPDSPPPSGKPALA